MKRATAVRGQRQQSLDVAAHFIKLAGRREQHARSDDITMGIAKIITGFVDDERRHSCSPRSRSPKPAAKARSAAAKAWA
jgi:hypothetical protein